MKFLPVEKQAKFLEAAHALAHPYYPYDKKRNAAKSIAETAGACKDPDSYGSVCSYYRGIYGGSGSPV